MNSNVAYVNLIYHQTIFQCPIVFTYVVTLWAPLVTWHTSHL